MTTKTTKTSPLRGAIRATALLAAVAAAGAAHAQTKTIYIGMNGGNMERTYSQFVFPPFEKANNVKVVVVPGTSTDILAKAQASKDKAQMQVMTLDDGVMYRAIGMGLCEKLKPSANIAEVPAIAKIKDSAVGLSMGLTGLAYNTKMFAEKGWAATRPGAIWPIPSSRARWWCNPCPRRPSACMPS